MRCLYKTELQLTHHDYGCQMCTVILAWQVLADAPLVLAANRDEVFARPSDPPLLLSPDPPRWGGRDRLAGGTWLAVDPAGRIGAVTNRHPGGQPPARDSSRRSRGALPLDLLAGEEAAALRWTESLEPRDYNPVNVLYASPTAAWCTSMDDEIGRRTLPLRPGVHVLTEQDADDVGDEKTQAIRRRATDAVAASSSADQLVEAWRGILRSHDAKYAGTPVCIHGGSHGTVSSSTVVVSERAGVRYEHAEGPPCVTPFESVLDTGLRGS